MGSIQQLSAVFCLLFVTVQCVIPGVNPRDYQDGESIEVKIIPLDSVKTQLPYDFYSLPFCQPDVIGATNEHLGEILSGDKIENSLYEVNMKVPEDCKVVCQRTYTDTELQHFADKVEEDYRVNWLLDNLPAATKYFTESVEQGSDERRYDFHYERGFPLGFVAPPDGNLRPGQKYINNHIKLIILYHENPDRFSGARVVGFEVEAFSVRHHLDGEYKGAQTKLSTCSATNKVSRAMMPQPVSDITDPRDKTITWTYGVQWERSDVRWASRWDVYLKMTDSRIHWFSILNSIIIVAVLTGMVALIMTRTLHRDLRRYNEVEMSEEMQQEETGWKLIHGEVFRPPQNGGALAMLVGTGVQVLCMTIGTLVLAALGMASPANRGWLIMALLLFFVSMGFVGGYVSTRIYKTFMLSEWRKNAWATSLFFPGIAFSVFFFNNWLLSGQESSGAVDFRSLASLVILWVGVSVPLVFLGCWTAFKQPVEEPPCKINTIPRMLPPMRAWYNQPSLMVAFGGVLPFGTVFFELFFIMSSVWQHQYYYLFGVLFVVAIIVVVTCAEISIMLVYLQLSQEDYNWWWRSFLTSGSSAVYIFLYSILYFFTRLQIVKVVSALVFFSYMFLTATAFFVLTGSVGFLASYAFVRKIYSSLKID